MSAAWKTVRVFSSSNFRAMHSPQKELMEADLSWRPGTRRGRQE